MLPGFLQFRPDIPFARDDTNRFLPWIVAFIVFITAMMIASGMGIYGLVSGSRSVSAPPAFPFMFRQRRLTRTSWPRT